MERTTGRFDQFRDAHAMDEAKAKDLAGRLEKRGAVADEIRTRAAYLDLLGVGPGKRVLEVGCGSGVVLRDVARRVAPNGRAVGLDPSQPLLAIAQTLVDRDGLSEVVELRTGAAASLPFGEGEFDVALAVTTLSHIADADAAVGELVRVVRSGGRVGVFDRDDDTFVISHPDRDMTRRIVAAGAENAMMDPWLTRRLPRLLIQAGLRDVQVQAFASIEQDPDGFFAMSLRGRADIAARAGAITQDELTRWLDQLVAEGVAGGVVAGLTHLFVWGTKS